MSISRAEIIDALSNMTVLELSQLIKELEDKFGVSAAAPVAMAAMVAPAAAEAAPAEEDHELGSQRSQRSGGERPHHPEGGHLQGGSRRS
jgi:ribosomal protein L7/L12